MSRTITLSASDVTGQKIATVRDCPGNITVSELVHSLRARMQLPPNDTTGRPLTYGARLAREGRALNGGEVVGEALRPEDRIVLQPSVDAG